MMSDEVVSALISATIGGLLVAVANHLFTRRRTQAETEKLMAETEKTRAETAKLITELQNLSTTVEEAAYYRSTDQHEQVIFDSLQGVDHFDIDGQASTLSTDPTKQLGQGSLSIKQGVVSIERTNTMGGFSLTLRRYAYQKSVHDYLPKDPVLAGRRKIRFGCQAKVTRGDCQLMCALIEAKGSENLEVKFANISQDDWHSVELYFRITPNADALFQIHQVGLSNPSTLLLRNIVLAERPE